MKFGKIKNEQASQNTVAEHNADREIVGNRAISSSGTGGATDILDRTGVEATAGAGGVADANYYVATTGSDTTGDGSSGNPWATVGKALEQIQAKRIEESGTTINVAAGTYDVSSSIKIDHNYGRHLTISGAGATTIFNNIFGGTVFILNEGCHVTLGNLKITQSSYNPGTGVNLLNGSDINLSNTAIENHQNGVDFGSSCNAYLTNVDITAYLNALLVTSPGLFLLKL